MLNLTLSWSKFFIIVSTLPFFGGNFDNFGPILAILLGFVCRVQEQIVFVLGIYMFFSGRLILSLTV